MLPALELVTVQNTRAASVLATTLPAYGTAITLL